jgi:hypothetical protein
MNWRSPLSRMMLVGATLGLMAFCFAYWWQGNLWHEVAGTVVLVLTLRHVLNNTWWWRLNRGRWTAERYATTALTLLLAVDVLVVTITSIWISRNLPIGLPGVFTLREIHWFAAWWMLVLAGLHLGLNGAKIARFFNWQAVPLAGRVVFGLLSLAVAVQGIWSGAALGLWPQLRFQYSLVMWDFNAAALPFFGHWIAIVTLFAVLGYGVSAAFAWKVRRRQVA